MDSLEKYSIENSSEEEMYQMYVQTLLEQKLYNVRDAYDACHYLMVPLHYAFQSQNEEYIHMFQKQMDEFASLSEEEKEAFRELSILDQLHYLYFSSEYMCLCAERGLPVTKELFSFVYEETECFTETYVGAWESTTQYQNFWELLEGLLSGEGYGNGKSYSNIVTDIDLYILTTLCDLKVAYEKGDVETKVNEETFSKAVSYVEQIFSSQVSWYEDGTWQFQVGAWKDHPDYAYAGISNPDEIEEGVDYRIEDCTWDVGHFMRMPIFLRSYQRAAVNRQSRDYYGQLLEGYGTTFVKNVLVAPDEECEYYRLNNYMNGCNGLYRYGYHEKGVGIGPYQNSICFLMGLYAFCGNDTILETYRITAQKFPLDMEGKEVYRDPVTVREQNPIFVSENYEQFLCYLASKLRM